MVVVGKGVSNIDKNRPWAASTLENWTWIQPGQRARLKDISLARHLSEGQWEPKEQIRTWSQQVVQGSSCKTRRHINLPLCTGMLSKKRKGEGKGTWEETLPKWQEVTGKWQNKQKVIRLYVIGKIKPYFKKLEMNE